MYSEREEPIRSAFRWFYCNICLFKLYNILVKSHFKLVSCLKLSKDCIIVPSIKYLTKTCAVLSGSCLYLLMWINFVGDRQKKVIKITKLRLHGNTSPHSMPLSYLSYLTYPPDYHPPHKSSTIAFTKSK